MKTWQKAILSGVLASGLCLGGITWIIERQADARRLEFEREVQAAAQQLAIRVRGGLEKHLVGLVQMANFFRSSPALTEEQFFDFASALVKTGPRVLRVCAVEPSFRIRWVYPPEENRLLGGFDLTTYPEGHAVLLRAREAGDPIVSPPLRLIGDDPGFVLAVPVLQGERFLGVVAASFRNRDFFASLLLHDVLDMYEHRVLNSGQPVYASGAFESPNPATPVASARFTLGGGDWEVQLQPRAAVAEEHLRSGQRAVWALGWIVALAAGAAAGAAAGGFFYTSAGMRRRLEAQGLALQQTREKLDDAMHQLLQAEKLAALADLVAGVAHEINNPLCSVIGYSQLALARPLPTEIRRHLETVHNEAERMGRIVGNLLAFARKQPPEKKHLGLNGLIEKTLELKAYHFRANQIEIDKDLAPDLAKTMLDFHQIQQVILNLLTNAEQAIRESRKGGRIRIRTREHRGFIELTIADDGPGIAPEHQQRLFEPFFTTKQGSGTGLGLSLAYGIIQGHGGSITADSQPGQGATFTIELPIVHPFHAEAREKVPASANAVPGLRILVVDDERSVQDLMVDLLSARGHSVDTASDVPEALEKIAGRPLDLIITDMKMPRGSAKDIYKAVAEKSPQLARRIVFTTGDGATGATQEFVQDTGNELVLKPFKIEQIEQAIARAIHQ